MVYRKKPNKKVYSKLFNRFSMFLLGIVVVLSIFILRNHYLKPQLSREKLSQVLKPFIESGDYPVELDLPLISSKQIKGVVQYSFDSTLQSTLEKLFKSYRPDYGAFVALDPKTGRVLSLISYEKLKNDDTQLALKATFPSASVFKVITAAAAIEEKKFSSETLIPYNGSNHTLYRRNVLSNEKTRWTRNITLKDAFARSINTVFGKLGVFSLEPTILQNYAEKFGFNRKLSAEVPAQQGKVSVSDSFWERAEVASGFTKNTTMSPLQGAMIASLIVNDGKSMEPYFVSEVFDHEGTLMYRAKPQVGEQVIDKHTSLELKELMRATLTNGTASKSFRGFFKNKNSLVDAGGKTGSLTGDSPPGKYDWFVGFAEKGDRKIALSVLTIHKEYWNVKSSYLARKAFEVYFDEKP